MRLKNEVMRNILMYVEENTTSQYDTINVDSICSKYGYDRVECIYHCDKMYEGAFFTERNALASDDYKIYEVHALSFKGHSFYESLKNESIFNKIKDGGVSMSFEVLFEIAKELTISIAKNKVGLK